MNDIISTCRTLLCHQAHFVFQILQILQRLQARVGDCLSLVHLTLHNTTICDKISMLSCSVLHSGYNQILKVAKRSNEANGKFQRYVIGASYICEWFK